MLFGLAGRRSELSWQVEKALCCTSSNPGSEVNAQASDAPRALYKAPARCLGSAGALYLLLVNGE